MTRLEQTLFLQILAQWGSPALIDPENENVTFKLFAEENDFGYQIEMDEELDAPIVIAKLNFTSKYL